MRSLVAFLTLIALVAGFTAPAHVAAQEAGDVGAFRIVLEPGMLPTFTSADAVGVLVRDVPGEALAWNVTSAKARLVGEVVSRGYFDVARAKQILPEVDDHFFFEVRQESVADAGGGARVANATGEGANARLTLGFPVVNGTAQLNLTRDVLPPTFEIGSVRDLTHGMFYLETRTHEYAFADLIIQDAARKHDPVRNPTTMPALLQRFPIQGLRADTPYVFFVDFWDWSGNRVRSPEVNVTTLPKPDVPSPAITAHSPGAGEKTGKTPMIMVNFTNPEGDVQSVQFFLDKRPIPLEALVIEEGRAWYVPTTPLAPGMHSMGVEITNSLGGKTGAQWKFEVAGAPARDAPGAAAALSILALAALAIAWRRQ